MEVNALMSLWRDFGHIASVTPLSNYTQTGYLLLSVSSSVPYITHINHGIEEFNYFPDFVASSLQLTEHEFH